ncbi:MAG: hypothetical protein JNJ45_11795 [Chthonomonas sp.]|nr:hypothetical protein [Chthonomonas sp.]
MSLRINTNTQALNALRNLNSTVGELGASISRLSTGMRINRAGDDPAGLIISEGMRAQLQGIDQAIRNSQDAVNMTKTAEAALEEVQRLVRNLRGLAVASANTAVVDSASLQANQSQIRSTLQSIDRIAEQTAWGNKKILDGTAGAVANVTDITNVSGIYMSGTFGGEPIINGSIQVLKQTAATKATTTLGNAFASGNAVVTQTGSFVINGYSIASSGSETVNSLVAKVNNLSASTGVVASVVPNGANVSIKLEANQYGSQFGLNFFDPSNIIHNAASASATGIDAIFDVTAQTTAGSKTVQFKGGQGPKESGLKLSDTFGNIVTVTEAGNAGLAALTNVGAVTAGNVRFQIGANANQAIAFSMPQVYSRNLGLGIVGTKSLTDLDVTTQVGAEEAMQIVDAAVNQLAQWRGELGSFQANFLDSTVKSLSVAKENLTASESQIRDADMAEEMTNYTRLQILQQSGMAMLAQANQTPQQVLSLIRGQ